MQIIPNQPSATTFNWVALSWLLETKNSKYRIEPKEKKNRKSLLFQKDAWYIDSYKFSW